MCSINKPQGLTYVPRLKCQPLPWKGSLLVVGKTEQRAAGAGQEQRSKVVRGLPGHCQVPTAEGGLAKGPLASAAGAVRPWASHFSCQTPVSAAIKSQCAQEPSEKLLSVFWGAAAPEQWSLTMEEPSRPSPAWLRSTFQLFNIMAGERTKKKVLWLMKPTETAFTQPR